jgi:hypothetical protein
LTAVTRANQGNNTFPEALPASFEYTALPGFSARGTVRDKKTGLPVAGVKLSSKASHYGLIPTLTDANGCFEIMGYNKSLRGPQAVMANPQTGRPYFCAWTHLPANPVADIVNVDLNLVSGIALSGKVTSIATGKPPRAAVVEYYPLPSNPHRFDVDCCPGPVSSALTEPDGSYTLAVLPGPGLVCVTASPRDAYASAAVDHDALGNFLAGNSIMVINEQLSVPIDANHVLMPIDPEEKAEAVALDIELQPAGTLQGSVVGHNGEPLSDVECRGLNGLTEAEVLVDGSFTVTELSARRPRDLYFRHRKSGQGRVVSVDRSNVGPLKVELVPCGSVMGRLVDGASKPVPDVYLQFSCIKCKSECVLGRTDRDGRFRGILLPGQKYSLQALGQGALGQSLPGEFEVDSGQTKDLGDLRLVPQQPKETIAVVTKNGR